MKYLCRAYLEHEHWSACPEPVSVAHVRGLTDSDRLVAGAPLHPVHTATTVRVRNGQVQPCDGPFAETKALLAGFYPVNANDLNEAIQIASGTPRGQTRQHRGAPGAPARSGRRRRFAAALRSSQGIRR